MASPVNSHHFPTPPPPSSSGDSTTVIIVAFVSLGCLFFVAFCLFALWCFVRYKKKKTVQETDLIHANEHRRIREAIVEGPRGPQTVVLSVDDDKHFEEEIIKKEKLGKNMHAKSSEIVASRDIESGKSSSDSNQKA